MSNKLLSALMPGRFLANGLSIIIAMLVYAVAVIRVGTLSESDMLALPMGGRILRVCKRFKIFHRRETWTMMMTLNIWIDKIK
mgnify:FL=1